MLVSSLKQSLGGVLLLLLAIIFGLSPEMARAAETVQIQELPNSLRVEIGGKLWTEYFFKDVPRPYYYPLIGPGGAALTRNWPLRDTPGEEHDHLHHRSLWFAHGAVNGVDFWTEGKNCGRIVHVKFDEIRSGSEVGVITAENDWQDAAGKTQCHDRRTMRFYTPKNPGERIMDFEITLRPAIGELRLGDTKEGTLAVRLAETMRLKGAVGAGHIVNSNGERDDQTWGKRADWCDYYGPVDQKIVGIAIFDHPKNPRHPTWWHVRDYGLFAANPFGKHDFENLKDAKAGELVVPAGESVTFRYRLYLHEGDQTQADIARHYQDYVLAN